MSLFVESFTLGLPALPGHNYEVDVNEVLLSAGALGFGGLATLFVAWADSAGPGPGCRNVTVVCLWVTIGLRWLLARPRMLSINCMRSICPRLYKLLRSLRCGVVVVCLSRRRCTQLGMAAALR